MPPANKIRAGILLAVLTTLMFASMDAVSKHLGGRYSVVQIVWFQYFMVTGFALVHGLRAQGRAVFMSAAPGLQILRGLILVAETGLFVLAFRHLPLADAHAVGAAAPLIATALSVWLLSERVDRRRWAAVLVGFLGVLVIIRPGTGVFGAAALLPLGAACLFAIYQILTRRVGHLDSVATSLVYTGIVGWLVMSSALWFFWITPSPGDAALLLLGGCFGVAAHFSLITALSYAPASTIQPFNYSLLIWATLIGYIVFGDIPDLWTIGGASILVSTGIYLFRRG